MLKQLFQLIFPCQFNESKCRDNLFGCNCGKGDDEDPVPQYREDPATTALKNKIGGQVSGLLDIPYEEYEQRFTPAADTQGYLKQGLEGISGLISSEDYGIDDYSSQEEALLQSTLRQYKDVRGKGREELKEHLIGENLYDSGPGFGLQEEFIDETAKGSADITASLGVDAIQRKFQQTQYKDALERGDYTTMYNMALSKSQVDTAPAEKATQAQIGVINPALGLFGEMQEGDLTRYQSELNAYKFRLAEEERNKKNLGGFGALAGAGIGAALAVPTGGLSVLAGAGIGGALGGGAGSLFEY